MCYLQIGHWPRSRAFYGLDILLDASSSYMPRLLEVSFAPDFTSLLKFEPGLVNDVVHACFSNKQPSQKFWRLEKQQISAEQMPGYKELDGID